MLGAEASVQFFKFFVAGEGRKMEGLEDPAGSAGELRGRNLRRVRFVQFRVQPRIFF